VADDVISVREANAARLKRRLAGDLDNIVLKALQKEPAQRYASVEQLSEDVRKHLEGLPIIARDDTATYRIRKFIRRNRVGVATAVLILGTMVAAVAATQRQAGIAAAQAREAKVERTRAERQRQLADEHRGRAEREAARALLNSREVDVQRRLAESRARDAVTQRNRAEAQTREADAQRKAAERRFTYARDLASALFKIFDEVKDLPGSKEARLLIAQKAEEYTKLLAEDGADPSLREQITAARLLASTYDRSSQPPQRLLPKLIDDWNVAGSTPNDYSVQIDTAHFHSGKASGLIEARDTSMGSGFGTLIQWFSAEEYRGKRVRMSAFVKSENVESWAGLWMRVDGDRASLAFDNMQDRPIKGTRDWQKYDVVLDVPTDGDSIFFGILLEGSKGRVWIDDVQFDLVGTDVPTTSRAMQEQRRQQLKNIPSKPGNLDFEK
jgi:hypothetical protein